MRADIHAPNRIPVDVKNSPQIARNADRVHGFAVSRRQLVDFVRAQLGIEGIVLKNSECNRGRSPLLRRQFR